MMRPARLTAALILPFLVSACGDAGADYPALVPVGIILAEPTLSPATAEAAADPAAAATPVRNRADALRARATALRGPVIEPAIRTRMDRAVARHR